jgi:hypothetical protein
MANTAYDRAAKEVAELRKKEIEKHNHKQVQSNLKPSQSNFGFGY